MKTLKQKNTWQLLYFHLANVIQSVLLAAADPEPFGKEILGNSSVAKLMQYRATTYSITEVFCLFF